MKVVLIFLLLGLSLGFAQQTPQYTQFMFEKNFYNPGYIGISDNSVEGAISIKSYQYAFSPDGSYNLGSSNSASTKALEQLENPSLVNIALHGSSRKRNRSMGGRIQNDKQPFINQLYLSYYISTRKKIGFNKMLSIGFEAGVHNLQIRRNNLKLINTNDDVFDNGNSLSYWLPDLGIGAYFTEPRYYAGISVKNLTPFKYNWSENFNGKVGAQLYPHIYLSGGYTFKLGQSFTFQANGLYKMVLTNLFKTGLSNAKRNDGIINMIVNDVNLLDLNSIVEFKKTFALGATYRTNNTIAALVRLRMADRIYLSYSYDFPKSSLTNSFKGNNELLLNYLVDFGKFVERTIDPRYY